MGRRGETVSVVVTRPSSTRAQLLGLLVGAQALAGSPVLRWVFPDPEARDVLSVKLAWAVIQEASAARRAFVAGVAASHRPARVVGSRVVGVAWWLPPPEPGPVGVEEFGAAAGLAAAKRTGERPVDLVDLVAFGRRGFDDEWHDAVPRLLAWSVTSAGLLAPLGASVVLGVLGTAVGVPETVADALMAYMTRRLDRVGQVAAGVVACDRERDRLVRHGFRVVEEAVIPDGPPLWAMRREPATD